MAEDMLMNADDADIPGDKKMSPLTLTERLTAIITSITVEPMMTLYLMGSIIGALATQNLYLEKACRVNLGYDEWTCDALTVRETANFTAEETAVQTLVAEMATWRTVIQGVLPALLLPLFGAWSDRHRRRKPCMLIPLAGEIISWAGLLLCTYVTWWPMEVAGFIREFFPAITGAWFTLHLAAYSYIAEVSSLDKRTVRIGTLNIFVSVGDVVSTFAAGLMYSCVGFYGVFSIVSLLSIMAFLYCAVYLKEPEANNTKDVSISHVCDSLKSFFNLRAALATFQMSFWSRKGKERTHVVCVMAAIFLINGSTFGEDTVSYMFVRYRFNWDEVDFSYFFTCRILLNLIGTTLSVSVFSHRLKMEDSMLGFLSCVSAFLALVGYAFAQPAWVMFLVTPLEFMHTAAQLAMRSLVSKLVPSDELGQVNSMLGICQAATPLVFGPIYSQLYAATLEYFPGAFYLLAASQRAIAGVIFLWIYHTNRQEAETQHKLEVRPSGNITEDDLGRDEAVTGGAIQG